MPTRKGRETRKLVLESARALFREKGFQGVSIREIAKKVGMREASLYYYAPEGKEQLYVEVVKQELEAYREGMVQAIRGARPMLESQLRQVAAWFLTQTPPPLFRLFETDLQFLSQENREDVLARVFESLYSPLALVFRNAQIRGEIRVVDPIFLASQFLSTMVGMQHAQQAGLLTDANDALIDQTLDVLMNGLALDIGLEDDGEGEGEA